MGNALTICVDPGAKIVVEAEHLFLPSVDGVSVVVEGVCRVNSILMEKWSVGVNDLKESWWPGKAVLLDTNPSLSV